MRYLSIPAILSLAFLNGCELLEKAAAPKPADPTVAALVTLQKPSGAFGTQTTEHVGISAIAGLALLPTGDAAAHTSTHAITNFVLKNQQPNGLLAAEGDAGPMYGHAFATLYLTQIYQTDAHADKAAIKKAIEKAVKLTEGAQNADGGWRYTPNPKDADVSVTAAQLKALAAAKQAGFTVQKSTMDRAVAYIRSCQQPDGGFRYTTSAGDSGWARSASAAAALLVSGSPDKRAAAYLDSDPKLSESFFYYGNFYLAQTMNIDKGSKTYADLKTKLLARQNPTTKLWSGEAGDAYATAMAVLVLNIPTTDLPAFKR